MLHARIHLVSYLDFIFYYRYIIIDSNFFIQDNYIAGSYMLHVLFSWLLIEYENIKTTTQIDIIQLYSHAMWIIVK